MALQLLLATLAVLGIIYVVPLLLYGASSRFVPMRAPEEVGPARFLSGVLVTKLGTAIAFVALFWIARETWAERWLLYAALWWLMFAASEVGEAIAGRTSAPEAVVGIVSEAIYAPLAAWVARAMLS